MKSLRFNKESGAVSLFVVIFAMLLITVVTISFLRLMMADQKQAADNDLSQSAYDSAQAGVEDAKRALLRYQQLCSRNDPSCGNMTAALDSTQCNNALFKLGVVSYETTPPNTGPFPEVKVQQSETVDRALDQAYTCVTTQLDTLDYVGSLRAGESQIVPLIARSAYNTVTIRWFSKDDVSNAAGNVTMSGPATSASPLVAQQNWDRNRPSLMRAQLIQFGETFTVENFDSESGEQSNANTVFLYPTNTTGSEANEIKGLDNRKKNPTDDPDPAKREQTPYATKCQPSVSGEYIYSCSMSLRLPAPIGGGQATSFLRLTPFYNATSYQVVLSQGVPVANQSNIIRFKGVQPSVDSTGRANDMFRRIESRVNLYDTNFPYPDATIDITGNFCKNFSVADDPAVYTTTNTSCTP